MPDIVVNIDLYCDTCSRGVCGVSVGTHKRGQPWFRITACEMCISKADDAGYQRGYDDGHAQAQSKRKDTKLKARLR